MKTSKQPAAAAYEARPIKRHRSTQAELDQLDQQIIDVLAQDAPQSVRHLFYRMTDPRLPRPVPKSNPGYNLVQRQCVKLRERGRIPFGAIVDATRRGYFVATYTNAAEYLRQLAGRYRADLWADADCRAEVWVESRSIAGVVLDVCQTYGVSLYPAAGFASKSFVFDAAQLINTYDDGRPLVIYYIGDYDPAGVTIDRVIEKELRKHIAPEVEMIFVRLGITTDQVEQLHLPTKPRKAGDRRAPEVRYTVEAEAMPAQQLRELLTTSLEALLPTNALYVAKIAEASERLVIQGLATSLERGNDS